MSGLLQKSIKGQNDADNMLSYLNNQPDMLTAIVKHRTDYKGHPGDLFILPLPKTLDRMTIQTHPPNSAEPVEIDIKFDPPMEDFRDFRPRVLKYRDEAFKHFQVPSKPKVNYYSEPDLMPFTLPVVFGLSCLGFASYGTGEYADRFRALISDFFGPGMLPGAKWFCIIMHVAEAMYMAWAMFEYQVPFVSSILWVFTTTVLGFAAISEFWESVQYERMRIILRQTDVGEIPPRVGGTDVKPIANKATATRPIANKPSGIKAQSAKGKKKAQ